MLTGCWASAIGGSVSGDLGDGDHPLLGRMLLDRDGKLPSQTSDRLIAVV